MIQSKKHRAKYLLLAIVLTVLTFLLVSVYLGAGGHPRLTFPNSDVYNLGVVAEGQVVSHDFLFRNEGRGLLQVKDIKTSCGCTSARAEKRQLGSGETSKITVSYVGRNVPTEEVLQVVVKTNDPRKPFALLTLKCKVRLKLFWYPKTISFHCTHGEEDLARELVFVVDSAADCVVRETRVSSEWMTATCEKDGESVRCRIRLQSKCPKGNWTEKVTVAMSVDGSERDIVIPVNIMMR